MVAIHPYVIGAGGVKRFHPAASRKMNEALHFPFKPFRMSLWLLLFLVLAGGFAWMAWLSSLNPHFYDHPHGRHAWFGELMHDLPVSVRVGFWLCWPR